MALTTLRGSPLVASFCTAANIRCREQWKKITGPLSFLKGGNPGVFQTLSSGGSSQWLLFQHGEEKQTELESFFSWPLVLIQQDLQQAPWFQFGDVPQLSCEEEKWIPVVYAILPSHDFYHKPLVPSVYMCTEYCRVSEQQEPE
ncbi:hypothetical protein ATANTOWER_005426 [Ataeniobius toweri]|uniref:Uncharacterized protein n=1 Tax=Ataeniobius toweri TaxID=208326 RepID=A0ABU7AJY7_9TELE|nr:hypothetical protein [Ataeniobius toweri]